MMLRAAEPIRLQSFLTCAINVCDAGTIGDADLQTQPSFPDTGDLGPRPAPSDRDRPEFSGRHSPIGRLQTRFIVRFVPAPHLGQT
jgi:hypothetical protein